MFTKCRFEKKIKQPFKFDLGVLNFECMKVNCEIAKKASADGLESVADSSIKPALFEDVIQRFTFFDHVRSFDEWPLKINAGSL